MGSIINIFFPSLRNMASDVIVLSLSTWVLSIPFATFAIREVIKLFKKII